MKQALTDGSLALPQSPEVFRNGHNWALPEACAVDDPFDERPRHESNRKCAVFNLIWGTIIGLAIGASGKLLMEKEECGTLYGITVVGVSGSVAIGCLVGRWDPSCGIIASYFGAIFSLVIYSLIKNRREL